MKQPSKRSATDRDNMVCTKCDTEGLEENPAFRDEYSGRSALLKSTRCPNDSCEYHRGIPQDQIEMQMPDEPEFITTLRFLFGDFGGISISVKDILYVSIIVSVTLFILNDFGILSLQDILGGNNGNQAAQNANIQGSVSSEDFEVGSTVLKLRSLNDSKTVKQTTSNQDGIYVFTDVKEGKYMIYADHPRDKAKATPAIQVNVSEDGRVDKDPENLSHAIKNQRKIKYDRISGNIKFENTYKNPSNAEDINVTFEPLVGDTIVRNISVGKNKSKNIIVPTRDFEQDLAVRSPVSSKKITHNRSYDGGVDTIDLQGNIDARNLKIRVGKNSISQTENRIVAFGPNNGTTKNIQVDSPDGTVGAATVQIAGREGTAQDSTSGTFFNSRTETIDAYKGKEKTTEATLKLIPTEEERENQVEGNISEGHINESLEGSSPIENLVIDFDGGDKKQKSTLNTTQINVSGEKSSQSKEFVIGNAENNGEYVLEYESKITGDKTETEFWYMIGGEKTEITSNESKEFDLTKGDQVRVGGSANASLLGPENSPHTGSVNQNIEIQRIEIDSSGPFTGEQVGITVVAENTGQSRQKEEFQLYINGDSDVSTEATFNPGETKSVSLGERSISDEPGRNTIHVNNFGPKIVNTSDGKSYGEGTGKFEFKKLSDERKIEVDTDNDGDIECDVKANGRCSLERTVNPGNISLDVIETGLKSTDYTIRYSTDFKPQGYQIDVENDNEPEINSNQVLRKNESYNISIPDGEFDIRSDISNRVPIEYELVWNSDRINAEIDVFVDGRELDSIESNINTSKKYNVGELEQGKHNFTLESDRGKYEAIISWDESKRVSYPSTFVNGLEVCQSKDFSIDRTCNSPDLGGLSPDKNNTLQFDGGSDEFNYTLSYNARATAETVRIRYNSDIEVVASPSGTSGEWTKNIDNSILNKGVNNISVQSDNQNGLKTNALIVGDYRFDNKVISNTTVKITRNNRTIFRRQIIDGKLKNKKTYSIDSEKLALGTNKIHIESDSGFARIKTNVSLGPEENSSIDF